MMKKYIEIEMMSTQYGIGGSFCTEASFVLDNFKAPFVACPLGNECREYSNALKQHFGFS